MALSRREPVGYPEISVLSFDVLALLAGIQHKIGLDFVGPRRLSEKVSARGAALSTK